MASRRSAERDLVVEALIHLLIQWRCLDGAELAHLARSTPIGQIDLGKKAGVSGKLKGREVVELIATIDAGNSVVPSIAARILPELKRFQRERADVKRITTPLLLIKSLPLPVVPPVLAPQEVSTITARQRRWLVHRSQHGFVAGHKIETASQVYPGFALGLFNPARHHLAILKAATTRFVSAIPIGLTGQVRGESFLWVAGTRAGGSAQLRRYDISSARSETIDADPSILFALQGVRDVGDRTVGFTRTPAGWKQHQLFGPVI